jgi:hypothetical protein
MSDNLPRRSPERSYEGATPVQAFTLRVIPASEDSTAKARHGRPQRKKMDDHPAPQTANEPRDNGQ